MLDEAAADVWVDGNTAVAGTSSADVTASAAGVDGTEPGGSREDVQPAPLRLPQVRPSGEPTPTIASDGTPVLRYPFALRSHGNRIRLRGTVEVMTNDGAQVESEAPRGYSLPAIRAWLDPAGQEHAVADLLCGPDGIDGEWSVDVPIRDEAMLRVDIAPEVV